MGERAQAGFFGGSALIVTENGRLLVGPPAAWDEVTVVPPTEAARIAGGTHPPFPAVLFRTQAVAEAGGFDVSAGSLIDVDLFLAVALRFPIVLSREPCGFLTIHARSWSSHPGSIEGEYSYVIEKVQRSASSVNGVADVIGALAASRDLRLLQLAIIALEHSPGPQVRRFAEALSGFRNRKFARLVRALERVTVSVPWSARAVNQLIALRLRLLCALNLARLAVQGERRAVAGYRAELQFFKSLSRKARSEGR